MNTSLRNIHTGTGQLGETIFGYDDAYINRTGSQSLFLDSLHGSLHTNVTNLTTPEKGSFSHGMKVLAMLLKRYGIA